MDYIMKKAIKAIVADMKELGVSEASDTNKEIFLGLGFALGRIFEAETGSDMRTVGPLKVLEWAKAAIKGERIVLQ
jgi:hypothetical protein